MQRKTMRKKRGKRKMTMKRRRMTRRTTNRRRTTNLRRTTNQEKRRVKMERMETKTQRGARKPKTRLQLLGRQSSHDRRNEERKDLRTIPGTWLPDGGATRKKSKCYRKKPKRELLV